MKDTHLKDDVLVALCLDEAPAASSAHLAACPSCERRLVSTAALLDEIADAAASSTDAAFPPDRRARQQARILQRIDQQARVGRVLAFPHAHAATPSLRPHGPTRVRRWIAGAAAAGLFIGMLAGRLMHQPPVFQGPVATQPAPGRQPPSALRAATASSADDEFLREVESALERSGPVAFRRIDALTPVTWDWEMP